MQEETYRKKKKSLSKRSERKNSYNSNVIALIIPDNKYKLNHTQFHMKNKIFNDLRTESALHLDPEDFT